MVIGTFLMAAMTFLLAVATSVMAWMVYKTGKDDINSHRQDRDLDVLMHTFEHIISLAHLEQEQLGGLKEDTEKALNNVKQKVICRITG
jgi:hypothetical protein